MFNMILENKDGKQLTFGAGSPYTIKEFQGLNPPKATINTNTTATLDGGKFNSSKLDMRNINIAFAIEENAEENRLAVYKVIQSKMPLRIYYNSDFLDVFIDGYVEDVDISYFAMKNIVTVNVLCPFPYLKGAQEIINELAAVRPKFHFPFYSAQSKNVIPFPYHRPSGYTANGATFTYDNEGVITVNKVAGNATAYFALFSNGIFPNAEKFLAPNTSYILSMELEDASEISCFVSRSTGVDMAAIRHVATGKYEVSFTTPETIASLTASLYLRAEDTETNAKVKLMIRSAYIESDTWQSPAYSEKFSMGEVDTLATVSIPNDGSVVAGLTFELYAKKALSNPKIIDYLTAEYMEVNINMQMGDLITITTEQGNKTVTLLRDGVRTNIFNLLSKNSTWLQLDIGGGIYVYEVGTGTTIDLDVTIKHYDLYEGV